jgi:hypothetical protein
MSFVRAASPIWYFPDLVGNQLDDTYYMFTLANTFPYIPQSVYQSPAAIAPASAPVVWSNPIQFLPNGTLPDNIYWDPSLVYRLEIRQGNTQAAQLIYLISNFVPESSDNVPVNEDILVSDNLIINGQFSKISFSSPLTITTAGSYEVAPEWSLILTGSGTVTVTQITFSGTENVSGNSPTALQFNSSGWTTAILNQRLFGNGALFSGGSVEISLLAMASSIPEPISINYVPSDSGTIQPVVSSFVVGDSVFTQVQGVINVISPSTNTDLGNNGYVDCQIVLPSTGIITVTNVQFSGQTSALPTSLINPTPLEIDYQQQPIKQQMNTLFSYYSPSIMLLPKKSLTVGWNFRNNPYQFYNGNALTVSTTPVYTCDQTIVTSSAASSISVSRTTTPYGLFQIQALMSVTQGSIAVFQYIDPATIIPFYGYIFSVLVRARIVTSNNTQVKVKCRIFTINGLPNALSPTDPIASWDVNGNPVFASAYTAIAPQNDPAYVLQNNYDTNLFNPVCPPISFNKIDVSILLNSSSSATLGVMIYTVGNLNNTTVDSILIEEISFVPNPFAMDGLALTFDETLRECQYYYEKSYNNEVMPGTASSFSGSQSVYIGADPSHAWGIDRPFKVSKRVNPTLTWYSSVSGSANNIANLSTSLDVAVTSNGISKTSTGYPNTPSGVSSTNVVQGQWVADSRF